MTPPCPDDSEPIVLPPLLEPVTTRWRCKSCGSLTLLDSDDLCRHCWAESVESFASICSRAFVGRPYYP